MKAVVFEKYGPPEVLQIQEIAQPVPKDKEVLIKIHATTATAAEGLMRRGSSAISRLFLGLRAPRQRYRILGLELAGEIEAVGEKVAHFKIGDQVYGFTGFRPGAYAEYFCMSEKASLALKPTNMSYEVAVAMVDGASTALFFLRKHGRIQSGKKVLINGASGSIGSYAVQIAKHFGAEVTGVCSTRNLEMVRSLGADTVIDYTQDDFTKNGESYDIIFDTVGNRSFSKCKGSLTEDGRYLATNGNMLTNYVLTFWTGLTSRRKFVFAMSVDKRDSLVFLKDLIEAGKLRPTIDRSYPLEQVAEAHRYVESGHKQGNVVITV